MNNFCLSVLLLVILSCQVQGQDTLWVNTGDWHQSADTMQVLRFNETTAFDTSNAALSIPEFQGWELTVVNGDEVDHDLFIGGLDSPIGQIPAGETTTLQMPGLEMGTYRYYSSDERGMVMGLSGLIKVGFDADIQFHWNIADWMPSMVDSAAALAPVDWDSDYVPEYFSINSRSYPNTINDTNAHIELSLGDTCTISITNSGMMDHVFHFHGFHILWISSTVQTSRVGWTKDTVPMHKGEGITLQLVASQLGMYPVHNHNLIAVTNAGFYPGGMITMINVTP